MYHAIIINYDAILLNAKKENEIIKFLMLGKFTDNISAKRNHYVSVNLKILQGSV